ncbi:MAG: GNAT family N-acetyltransferase [Puniceicoccales bacterium]|jgi:phosphinothricin acetyltransferase|nr:GNAT family N-acetyltransferase [Puniceicoccales bacterium]
MPDLLISPARLADAADIVRIYNVSVLQTVATFQTRADTVERRRAWLRAHVGAHPAFVARLAGRVVGWCSLSAYARNEAWSHTVEDSVYLDAAAQGRGFGKRMLRHLLGEAASLGHRIVLARIEAGHAASIGLHARLGFVETGRLLRVGWKFGRWHDVAYMQHDLMEGRDLPPRDRMR